MPTPWDKSTGFQLTPPCNRRASGHHRDHRIHRGNRRSKAPPRSSGRHWTARRRRPFAPRTTRHRRRRGRQIHRSRHRRPGHIAHGVIAHQDLELGYSQDWIAAAEAAERHHRLPGLDNVRRGCVELFTATETCTAPVCLQVGEQPTLRAGAIGASSAAGEAPHEESLQLIAAKTA